MFANRAFSEHNEAIGEVAATTSNKIMQEASGRLHDFMANRTHKLSTQGLAEMELG